MTVPCHVHDVGKGAAAAGGGGAEGADSERGPCVPFSRPSDGPEEAEVKVWAPLFFHFLCCEVPVPVPVLVWRCLFLFSLFSWTWTSLGFLGLPWTSLGFFGLPWTSLDFFGLFFFFFGCNDPNDPGGDDHFSEVIEWRKRGSTPGVMDPRGVVPRKIML